MKHLLNRTIGIEQGDDVLFSDYEDGGEMWTGRGSRERRHALSFSQPFREPPAVHVALSMWDMDSATNARADISAQNDHGNRVRGGVPHLGRYPRGTRAHRLDRDRTRARRG